MPINKNKGKGGIKAILADLFELPREVMLDLPRITMIGNLQLYLENHRGVISYDQNQVRVAAKEGEIIIRGENLQIKNLMAEELVIKGSIECLEFELYPIQIATGTFLMTTLP